MGRRGEIFTRKIFVKEGEKTYFFNIKENRYGDAFLNLVESSKRDTGDFQRNSIMIYQEDLARFNEGFTRSADHLRTRSKEKFSLQMGEDSSRRIYHFSVKWNRFGWGSLFIAEERPGAIPGAVNERRNDNILIDERDMEDFMKGFHPALARLKEAAAAAQRATEASEQRKISKIIVKTPPKGPKAAPAAQPKRIVKAVKKD